MKSNVNVLYTMWDEIIIIIIILYIPNVFDFG